jgi:hypothetical protein
MDKINESMNMRFSEQKDLYLDLACFNPRRLPGLKKDGIPKIALDKVCSLIGDIDKAKLKEELISLVDVLPQINTKISERYEVQLESDKSEDSDIEEFEDEERSTCKPGEEVKICVYLSIYIKRLRRVCLNALNSKTTKRIFMRFSPMDGVIREEGLGV